MTHRPPPCRPRVALQCCLRPALPSQPGGRARSPRARPRVLRPRPWLPPLSAGALLPRAPWSLSSRVPLAPLLPSQLPPYLYGKQAVVFARPPRRGRSSAPAKHLHRGPPPPRPTECCPLALRGSFYTPPRCRLFCNRPRRAATPPRRPCRMRRAPPVGTSPRKLGRACPATAEPLTPAPGGVRAASRTNSPDSFVHPAYL